jgi:hypothetical protein
MCDERAVAFVAKLDELVRAKPEPASRELGALLNALECHVEDGHGHSNIVTSFERLFSDLASLRKIDIRTINSAKKILNDLKQYLHQANAGT